MEHGGIPLANGFVLITSYYHKHGRQVHPIPGRTRILIWVQFLTITDRLDVKS